MHRLKIFLKDPALYGLIALNLYFILEFSRNPAQYDTLIWLYLAQSVMIGIFSFLEMATTKNLDTGNLKPVSSNGKPVGLSVFFLLHYGFFHLVYFVFIATQVGFKHIDRAFFKSAIAFIALSQLVYFIRHKINFNKTTPKASSVFLLPYLRIIPMHFTILIPAFTGLQPSLVFIILRSVMDVAGYLITSPLYSETMQKILGENKGSVGRFYNALRAKQEENKLSSQEKKTTGNYK